ncbi:glucose-1-phosphate adenylyltransferase [Clostridium sp. SHJSY1]|uniref:glucose-1-phosphate adenylyltransferase n=1 Tax=Clostridium sp. SHJSY1 TaxID=2942483 RepID=UPI002875F209|nr:glucose-1-phosphate adenylyltransferase [Clostridium sp. SHJSY1]MDS0528469.1 glucose-1-phosphate adenylyltransferase [Clostridium sp. SHJSY1]
MIKKEIVAMILAGGQGTRLGIITKNIAKPAVPFGGKYRIIDFPLSNCSNSGIYTVGVLTQYKPLELNNHIGSGTSWGLDCEDGGVSLLQPHKKGKKENSYKGTANAIYQNIEFIDNYDPEYVLILSGDHIYKMDYSQMLAFHKEKEAEVTIGVVEVPKNEANRFGIMNVRKDMSIYEFEEKPSNPKGNLASMGIYIFNWKVLKQYLEEDEKDKFSSNDFGKNIIPNMIQDDRKMVAYPFKGYWKDVGTVDSLWQANMDLLSKEKKLNLYDENWKIYSKGHSSLVEYVRKSENAENSIIVEGGNISGELSNSIVFQGVEIGENSIISDSIIMPKAKIGKNVIVKKAIIGSEAIISDGARIESCDEISVVGEGEEVKMDIIDETITAI